MTSFQVYDVTETYVTVGGERSVQAFDVWGVDATGTTIRTRIMGTPHEIYADATQTSMDPMELARKLDAALLKRKSPCRRTGCCNPNDEYMCLESCVKDRETDRTAVVGCEIVYRRGFEVYEEDTRPFFRIRLTRSYYASSAKRWLESQGMDVYDSHSDGVLSFLLLKNFAGGEWYEADGPVVDFHKGIRNVPHRGEAPFRTMIFDIETIAKTYNNVDSDKAEYPIGVIGCGWVGENGYVAYVLGDTKDVELIPNVEIRSFESEIEMLVRFRDDWFRSANFVCGWNSDDFDLKYVFERAKRLGIEGYDRIDDGRTVRVWYDELAAERKFHCPGLVSIDFQKVIQKDTRIRPYDYKLKTMAAYFECDQKGDLEYDEIFDAFHGPPERKRELVKYCDQDVHVTKHIAKKTGIMRKLFAKCRVKRVLPRDETYRGASYTTTRLVKKYLRELDYVMLSPKDTYVEVVDRKHGKVKRLRDAPKAFKEIEGYMANLFGQSFDGGFVRTPVKGTYLGFRVATLDFNSLYPSIMRTFNMCRSTQLKRKTGDLPADKVWTSDLGYSFATHREGVCPRISRDMIDERNRVRRPMKDMVEGSDEYEQADALQTEYKIVANALYGQTGSDVSPLVDKAIAASTCAHGAKYAKAACELVEREFGESFGAKVLYGDTDSLMIFYEKSTGPEDTLRMHKIVQRRINVESGILHGHLKMGMEDVCNMYLSDKKKYYVKYACKINEEGTLDKPKIKIAGMDNRSRTPYVRKSVRELFESMLKHETDPTEAYVRILRDLAEGRVPISELKHSAALNKPLHEYENNQHVVAARQMVGAGLPVRQGDRIEYYKCLLIGSNKSAASSVVAGPFVDSYDLDLRSYMEEAIEALTPFRDSVKNYDKVSKITYYAIRRGTKRSAPYQNHDTLTVGVKRRVAAAQVGPMDRCVVKRPKRGCVGSFDDILKS